jgi:hypothetical protein
MAACISGGSMSACVSEGSMSACISEGPMSAGVFPRCRPASPESVDPPHRHPHVQSAESGRRIKPPGSSLAARAGRA